MDNKLEIKLKAYTKACIREIYQSEGLFMHDCEINQTSLDDGCELYDLITPHMKDRDDDDEYDRLQEECLKVVKEEFNRIMTEIKKAHAIIQTTLGV